MENLDIGIPLNGKKINNIRYADDTVLIADNFEGLKELIGKVWATSQSFGLDINTSKTKFMIISKKSHPICQMIVNNKAIERVESYTYLGTNVNEQWDHSREIRIRIEKARATFTGMSKIFRSHDLNLEVKTRLLRCYIFSVLLYGAEAWTLTEASSKKLEAFEMWLYRRMLRVPWTDKVSNQEILQRMRKDREVLNTVKRRKLQYLGHVMRNESRYQLLQCILQGKVDGKRGPGRRRISWLKNLRTWFNKTTTELFRLAVNKVMIARMVSNIRSE